MKGLVVIPFVDCWEETHQAVTDAGEQLDQQADILLIDNGSGSKARQGAEALARFARGGPQIRLWQHRPPMPSLAATWNRAHELGQPFTWIRTSSSKPGKRASSSDVSHAARPFVSPIASLQNSMPVHAIVERRKELPRARRSRSSRRAISSSARSGSTPTITSFCCAVARTDPVP